MATFHHVVSRHVIGISDLGRLHDDTPARFVTAAAVAGLSARQDRRRLHDGRDGGGDAGRHCRCNVEIKESTSAEVSWYLDNPRS
jgi:hypothetical protein